MDNETSTIYHKLCASTERLRRLTMEDNDSSKFEHQISKEQGNSLRLFSKVLYTKILNDSLENLAGDNALEKWLHITNVDIDKLTLLKEEISDVVDLLHFGRPDLYSLCERCKFSRDEKFRFVSATSNLRVYIKTWLESKIEPLDQFTDESLSWYGCESSPESSEALLSPEQDSCPKSTIQQLPLLVYNHPYDDQQPSTSTGLEKTNYKLVHQNDRRSLSVSESGADSGASDSGLGSAISQNSLPTTTPPHSPGCFATVVNNNRASPSPHHPHKICKGGGIMSAAAAKICQSRTLPATASSSTVQQILAASLGDRRRQSNTAACLVQAGVTPPASPSYLSVTGGTIQQTAVVDRGRSPEAAIAATKITKRTTGAELAKPSPLSLGEIMRSRSHESNLQARVQHCDHPPNTASIIVGSLSPPLILSSSTLSLGETYGQNAVTNSSYSKQSPTVVGSTSNIIEQRGPSVVRKSATFGAETSSLTLLSSTYPAPRKSSQPQQSSSPNDFKKLSVGAAYSPASPKPGAYPDSLLPVPPKSPCGPMRLDHNIKHRFVRMWKPSMEHCSYCSRVIGIGGERCQYCRIKAHSGCKDLLDDSCGLSTLQKRQMYEYLLTSLGSNPINKRSPPSDLSANSAFGSLPYSQSMIGSTGSSGTPWTATFLGHIVSTSGAESASSSSCNSSAPSTPAFGPLKSAGPIGASSPRQPGHAASASYAYLQGSRTKFTFPEPGCQPEVPFIHVEAEPSDSSSAFVSTVVNSESSGDASTIYGSWDGGRSAESVEEKSAVGDTASSNEGIQDLGHQWQRNKWTMSTIRGTSSSWREWTILYEDLKFADGSLLGKGRFGEVHRAYWHQDVAVKLLNMDHVDDDRQLETFKQEVSTFRHTRHENLVLFVGCCLIPPRLGIVMNFCKGQTLYTHIHWRRDRFDMNKIINIAIQLCQGMSYLHGKKIVHKDFRTKNIFVEANNKPVITDFSIFSVKRLCQTSPHDFDIKGLYVPERWLCYLSPELSRMLKTWTSFQQVEELPFNEASDVYSFGTVWYELLTYEFPYKKLSTDAIIWQCCKGIKPGLTNLTVAKEIKDVLVQCWTYKPEDRPNFHQLLKTFEKLPRKRLERSPSQPVHLSRSAESIF